MSEPRRDSHARASLAVPFAAEGDYVFVSSLGRGLDQSVPRQALKRALRAAEVDGQDRGALRFHDLRHTFASLLIAQGENVVWVSRQLGHESPNTTLRVYAHLFDGAEHAQRASAALTANFGSILEARGGEQGQSPASDPHAKSHPRAEWLRSANSGNSLGGLSE